MSNTVGIAADVADECSSLIKKSGLDDAGTRLVIEMLLFDQLRKEVPDVDAFAAIAAEKVPYLLGVMNG